jgi:hypothetical protein
MKKIIALFVIMLAFGVNANAQQKKATTARAPQAVTANKVDTEKEAALEKAALKDVKTLSEYVTLTPQQQVTFTSLFKFKHRSYGDNLSQERYDIITKNIEAKINSTLTPDQLSKVQGNAQLMKVLTTK